MANQSGIRFTKLAHLQGHRDAIYNFATNPAHKTVYSAGAEGYIVVWTAEDWDKGKLLLQADEAFYSIYYDSLNHQLYAGSRTGMFYGIDLSNNKLFKKEQRHRGGIFAIIRRGDQLISAGEDGCLVKEEEGDISKHKVSSKSIRALCIAGEQLAVASSDHNIYLLDQDMEIRGKLSGHGNSVFTLAALSDDILVSSGRDALIKIWDLKAYCELNSIAAHMYQVKSLAYKGNFLLSSSMDKSIKLWDTELNLLKVIEGQRDKGHSNCINHVNWLDDRMFVSCSDDRTLMVWQLDFNS